MARAFVNLLLVSPLKDNDKTIVIQLMDYDEEPPTNKLIGNDLSILNDIVTCYNALHELGLSGLASNPIRLESGQLKGIREKAYNISQTEAVDFDFSLSSLFGPTNSNILRSCLKTSQINDSNKNGAYGDLARNAIIAKPMEASGAFDPTYSGFDHNNTIVMYLGSTDGGVGNTLLDPDINSLYNYIGSKAWPTDKSRTYRMYSFRTIPYKKFNANNPDLEKAANAKRILDEMVPQSKGVIENLDTRPDYVRTANITNGMPYKLDALFLAGYSVNDSSQFDDTNAPGTNDKANPDSQTHRSHVVELISALMMVDCLNGDIHTPGDGRKLIYGYNVIPEPNNDMIQDQLLFSGYTTEFNPEMFHVNNVNPGVNLAHKLSAAVYSYAFLLKLQEHFQDINSNPGNYNFKRRIIRNSTEIELLAMDMFGTQILGGEPVDPNKLGEIANKITVYLNAIGKLVKMIYEVQETSRFGSPNCLTINILPHDGLKALLEPEEHTEYFFSSSALWIPRSTVNEYEETLMQLRDCEINDIIYDKNTGNKRNIDEAAKKLLKAVYELFLLKLLRCLE